MLLAVLFIATLSFGSIATANAEEIETAQTQTDNISSVEEKINTQINDIKTLNKSVQTHTSSDKQVKHSKEHVQKHASMERGNLKAQKYVEQNKTDFTKKNQYRKYQKPVKPDSTDNARKHYTSMKQETSAKNSDLASIENTKTTSDSIKQASNNQTTQVAGITEVTENSQNTTVTENNQNITVPILEGDDSTRTEPIQTITEQNNKTDNLNTENTGKQTIDTGNPDQESYNSEVNYASGEITVTTQQQIRTAAVNVQNFINKNGRAPRTVNVGGIIVDYAVFLRMAAAELNQLHGSGNSNIEFRPVKRAPKSETTLKKGNLNIAHYMDITRRALNYMNTHERMPNYITTVFGRMSPEQYLDMISRILGFYHQNNRLPSFATIGRTVRAASTPSAENTSGGSKQPIPTSLQSYLRTTSNSQVTNAQIQNLAREITGGSNDINAATRLFNWVRDNIRYSFYRNTKRGAVRTLNERKGNCVDQAHLLVALNRAAGIPARYVHGNCRFSSGKVYGHVWAEVWVNGKWYKVDSTSVRNRFGVINSWSLINLKGRYTSLPF